MTQSVSLDASASSHFRGMRRPVLALDVGGTKIAAALVAADGRILRRTAVPTPTTDDAEVVGAAIVRALADVRSGEPISALGVGSAGPLDLRAGTVSPVNIPAWRGYPLVEMLRAAVPGVPVTLAGDGQCMALGEYWLGGGQPHALLGMVVSTGVGGGIVLGGRLQTGSTGSAGHIGHITLDPQGPRCPCGGRGCVETYASGPSMVAWALDQGWSPPPTAAADGAALAATADADADTDTDADADAAALTTTADAMALATTATAGAAVLATIPAIPAAPAGGTDSIARVAPRAAAPARGADPIARVTRVAPDAATLAATARAADPIALAAFARSAEALAASIVCAAALVELDDVVLGGGVINGAADLLLADIRAGVARIAGMDFIRRVRIRAGALGADAGLLGAAALGLQNSESGK